MPGGLLGGGGEEEEKEVEHEPVPTEPIGEQLQQSDSGRVVADGSEVGQLASRRQHRQPR